MFSDDLYRCASADRDDATKVLGRLREPLITPTQDEREGYVPNVVYSYGAMLHGRELIIPYAVSDFAIHFATFSIDSVLAAMEFPWACPFRRVVQSGFTP